ncbi:small integral membrane protein 22 isoform X2 [Mesocricetus auratus]|uniref:Small integral membrane protein 22 isoform X2 n=1 Tax=Mesocricetus auratus TaxID=10036 RepID=A0A1U8CCL4_MESAU|nr:small integral membrane protein 22 isoform X2 [Mesocricetus auratus]
MGPSADELRQELEATAEEVLGRLKSRQLFQSEWDIAAFVVFLTFVGIVVLLLLLVVIHCCCCCTSPRPRKEKPKGVDNLALEP